MEYRDIFFHNIALNGPVAMFYAHGLSATRYIEYSSVSRMLKPEKVSRVLDIGGGYSLMPSLLTREGYTINVLDMDEDVIAWQKSKMRGKRNGIEPAVGSALNLPYEDGSFEAVTCISVLEHIKNDGDLQAMREMHRVLKDNGSCIVSVSIAPQEKYSDWLRGIPPWLLYCLGKRRLTKLLKLVKAYRNDSFIERCYAVDDVIPRFSDCGFSVEESRIYWDWDGTKYFHKVIPMVSVSVLEYIFARIFTSQKWSKGGLGFIILKLRKTPGSIAWRINER